MIPINLASLFPDWNSLDAVRHAHSILELWAIGLFAALMVCDVIAHLIEDTHKAAAKRIERVGLFCFALAVAGELAAYKYGQRNDDLSAGVINSLDAKAGDALKKASDAHTLAKTASDIAGPAKETADEAKGEADSTIIELEGEQKKRVTLENQLGFRELTPAQADAMTGALKPFPQSRIVIAITSPDSAEKRQYAWDMLSIFLSAKWNFVGFRMGAEIEGRIPIGVSVWCGGNPCAASSAVLHNALCAAGIMTTSVSVPEYGSDTILVIGDVRPPLFQDTEHLSVECKTPWPIPKQQP